MPAFKQARVSQKFSPQGYGGLLFNRPLGCTGHAAEDFVGCHIISQTPGPQHRGGPGLLQLAGE